jgi:hypothetical protein
MHLTGEKLFDMPGEDPKRISRRKLRNFLSQGSRLKFAVLPDDEAKQG